MFPKEPEKLCTDWSSLIFNVPSPDKAMDWRVPEDFSLAGFDGLGHHLLCTPHVTTVRQPVYEIGERLAKTLLDRLDGSQKRICELVVPEVVEGQSVETVPR